MSDKKQTKVVSEKVANKPAEKVEVKKEPVRPISAVKSQKVVSLPVILKNRTSRQIVIEAEGNRYVISPYGFIKVKLNQKTVSALRKNPNIFVQVQN